MKAETQTKLLTWDDYSRSVKQVNTMNKTDKLQKNENSMIDRAIADTEESELAMFSSASVASDSQNQSNETRAPFTQDRHGNHIKVDAMFAISKCPTCKRLTLRFYTDSAWRCDTCNQIQIATSD